MKFVRPVIILFLLIALISPVFSQTAVTGEVFRDFNSSGVRETGGSYNEPPVANVTVTAYDLAGNIVDTTTTDANGQYSLTLPASLNGERVKIEFTNLPNNLQPGTHEGAGTSGSGTTVQFITGGGATTVDLSLSAVGQYCGAGTNPQPDVVTSCFVFGDQTTTDPTVVQVSYNATGNNVPYTELANAMESGTVYGFGYHNPSNIVFFSNYVRRHAGTTPNGGTAGANLDTLYAYSRNGDSTTTFDMETLGAASFGSDNRTATWDFISEDDTSTGISEDNWDMVGKVGAGDVELSDDGNLLFVTNLNARRVEVFTVSYGVASATTGFIPGAISLTHTGAIGPFTPACSNGVARPFGLKYHDGQLYTGVVCTAESGGTASDLTSHVFEGATEIFSMDLQFSLTSNHRGCAGAESTCTQGASTISPHFGDWNPWSTSFTVRGENTNDATHGSQVSGPEPILSDIEFDNNGDMILGFRDRFGDMVGYNSISDPLSNIFYSSWGAGDMYRVCNVSGTFVLEGFAGCPQNATNGDGPNGGEFYPSDNAINFHGEAFQGALVQVPGRGEVVTSYLDPTNRVFSGGFRRVSNVDGSSSPATGAEIFNTTGPGSEPNTAGKGNGMGDLEALCPPAPLEIGNLVWIEDVRDGIQGTGTETTFPNILLELIDPTTGLVIAQSTTDATGHYYFNATDAQWDTNGDSIFGDAPPLWDLDADGIPDPDEPRGIMPFTNYTVRVADSNFTTGQPLENLFSTAINIGSGITENSFIISDSEGISVTFSTGAFGVNNHTLDFGFTPEEPPTNPPTATPDDETDATPNPDSTPSPLIESSLSPTLVKSANPPFAQRGDTVTWTIRVSNPSNESIPNVQFTDVVPDELIIISTSATAGIVTVNNQNVSVNIVQLAPGQVIEVNIVTQIRTDIPLLFAIENIVILQPPLQGSSVGTVLSVSELPATGETPHYRSTIFVVLATIVSGLSILLGWRYKRR